MTETLWAAVADPHRRRVIGLLRTRPHHVTELVAELGLSQPGVSKHLRVLRTAGLVRVRADGQRREYSLDPRPLRVLDHWLEPYRGLWDGPLDELEQHLDEQHPDQQQEVTP